MLMLVTIPVGSVAGHGVDSSVNSLATSQTPCASGYYQSATAQDECIEVQKGNYSLGTAGGLNVQTTVTSIATAPIPCPAGYYQGSDGQSSCDATRQDIIQTVQSLTKLVAQKLLSARFHVRQEHINLLLLKAPATSQMLDTSLKDQQEVMEFPTQYLDLLQARHHVIQDTTKAQLGKLPVSKLQQVTTL